MKTKTDDTRFKNWLIPFCIPICGLVLIILIVALTGYFGSSILPIEKDLKLILCNFESCPFFENFGSYLIVGILVYCYIGLIIFGIASICLVYFMIADLIRQFMYGHESIMHE